MVAAPICGVVGAVSFAAGVGVFEVAGAEDGAVVCVGAGALDAVVDGAELVDGLLGGAVAEVEGADDDGGGALLDVIVLEEELVAAGAEVARVADADSAVEVACVVDVGAAVDVELPEVVLVGAAVDVAVDELLEALDDVELEVDDDDDDFVVDEELGTGRASRALFVSRELEEDATVGVLFEPPVRSLAAIADHTMAKTPRREAPITQISALRRRRSWAVCSWRSLSRLPVYQYGSSSIITSLRRTGDVRKSPLVAALGGTQPSRKRWSRDRPENARPASWLV